MKLMNLIYKPFGIVTGLIAGFAARSAFNKLWERIDDAEPPEATTRDTTLGRLVFATAVQGATMAVVRNLVNRGGASTWHWLTGVWPGDKRPDPAD